MEISLNHLKPYVVDRFEGSYAILIDKYCSSFDVLRDELPPDTREGDVLHENEGAFIVDEEATRIKREKIQRIHERLMKK